jgi:hypothetical protein
MLRKSRTTFSGTPQEESIEENRSQVLCFINPQSGFDQVGLQLPAVPREYETSNEMNSAWQAILLLCR